MERSSSKSTVSIFRFLPIVKRLVDKSAAITLLQCGVCVQPCRCSSRPRQKATDVVAGEANTTPKVLWASAVNLNACCFGVCSYSGCCAAVTCCLVMTTLLMLWSLSNQMVNEPQRVQCCSTNWTCMVSCNQWTKDSSGKPLNGLMALGVCASLSASLSADTWKLMVHPQPLKQLL